MVHLHCFPHRQLRVVPEDPGCEGGVLSSGWLEEDGGETKVWMSLPTQQGTGSYMWTLQTGTSKMSLNNYFLIHPALVTSDVTAVKMCEVTPGSQTCFHLLSRAQMLSLT